MSATNAAPAEPTEAPALATMSATYSPEDNKLRLYTVHRLDEETYQRVKAAGFKWAPKQELFVAPMWTPERAALLMELCGEIGDEDTSLVDRAEERAERFEEYSSHRAADAHAARNAVAAIADNIPLGQPILVGHHSEKRARKDAERIQNGMRRAVDMWETSQYWTARAKGALAHAKYKELPAVRHRRIKGLESDKRKQLREIEDSEKYTRLWTQTGACEDPEKSARMATEIANYDYGLDLWSKLDRGQITGADAAVQSLAKHARRIEHARAWLAHIEGRIAYERAMLDEQGGTAASKYPLEVGGRIMSKHWRARGKAWIVITKANKDATGAIGSVSTTEGVIEVETITDYRGADPGDVAQVKASKKLAPLVNYPGEGFKHMTQAEYTARSKHSDSFHVRPIKASDKHGAYRLRHAPEGGGSWGLVGVYLTDAKRTDPPAPVAKDASETSDALAPIPVPVATRERAPEQRTEFDDMKQALRDGVAVVAVSAPELFPTPPALAARMVRISGACTGWKVLEPSAGTGNIVREIAKTGADVLAVEINATLAESLRKQHPTHEVCAVDFLELDDLGGLRRFDAVVMNPPFSAEQEHVRRAFDLLIDGGTLVSVMSAGIRFRQDKRTAVFRAFVEEHGEIEDLPDDSFASSGTSVRTVLVTMRKTIGASASGGGL